jgi:carbamoyltransferase
MAMACMGDSTKYFDVFYHSGLKGGQGIDFPLLEQLANQSEQNKFDIAAGLQKATEVIVKERLDKYIERYPYENICLSGGVALNSVMVGKMFDWYPHLKSIYVDPVPYDAGLALGSARYVWHNILDNPRIKWEDNSSPYLGKTYNRQEINESLDKFDCLKVENVGDDRVIDILSNGDGNVISVYGGGSESGRRALGNRSILADPRNKKMKDIINEKVKHRQWYRPFAPSILRDKVKYWFEKDIDSPYMSAVIKFKEEVRDLVPAVVHFDGSARLQTVTENDNNWYYNFIKKFEEKTNVPILLNTSFNDQEPIVETPEHAINCFLKTNIDYLYFRDTKQLISKI